MSEHSYSIGETQKEFTTNAAEGLKFLKEKYNIEFVTSGLAVTTFREFNDSDTKLLTQLLCITALLIEQQRYEIDGIKEGTTDKMLASIKETYIDKIKTIELNNNVPH